MSVGSQALERSALEAKDRESLQQIAAAMGGKPGSRAKKADLVDMILELAGVPVDAPAPPAGGSDEAPADAPADAQADAPGTPAEAAAPRKRATRGRAGVSEGEDQAGPEADTTAGETADRGPRSTPRGSAVRVEEGSAEAPPREDATTNGRDDQRAQPRNGQDQNATSGADIDQAAGAPNQGGPREDGEGNRRRRRRGRDRNRDGQPGQPGQPGQADKPAAAGQADRAAGGDDAFVGEPVEVSGLLDLRDEGYGFLRLHGYLPSKEDVYVSVKQVRQFGLRKGDHLAGAARPASRNEKNPALLRIDEVNGADPEVGRARPRFEDLTPLSPHEVLRLETPGQPDNLTARIIDLIAPIGKGQRGLIVSPPKAGKTTILTSIAQAIEANHPDLHLMVLLVDERPEEVTAMARAVQGEVIATTFDRPADEHTMITELAIERAKRLVEDGQDVVIILDGLTRLARAYNLAAPATGRVLSGGIDSGAIFPPKKFFGAARNIEEGGSLTILATALVETGSRIDEVIFEEFEGTANMELRLDRRLADRRVHPAIDVDRSSTRHEELLFEPGQLDQVGQLRRLLAGLSDEGGSGRAGLELLVERLGSSASNDAFLAEVAKAPSADD